MEVELDEIPVHSLVPAALRDLASADEFMARLPQHDGEMAALLQDAEAAGECLRFVGALFRAGWELCWLSMYAADRRGDGAPVYGLAYSVCTRSWARSDSTY